MFKKKGELIIIRLSAHLTVQSKPTKSPKSYKQMVTGNFKVDITRV